MIMQEASDLLSQSSCIRDFVGGGVLEDSTLNVDRKFIPSADYCCAKVLQNLTLPVAWSPAFVPRGPRPSLRSTFSFPLIKGGVHLDLELLKVCFDLYHGASSHR